MKKIFLICLLLFLQSCSCSKEEEKDDGTITFDAVWEKYHLLCNMNIANKERCNELQEQLDQFGPEHVSEKMLQTLVQQCNGDERSACVILTWYFIRTNKYENAIKFGKSHCPRSPVACFYVGEAYSNMNMLAEALPFLEQSCKLEESAGCERIGHFFLGEQKPQGAIKYFRKACDLEEAFGCYNLACTYSLLRNAEMSYNAFEEALQLGFEDWATIAQDKDLEFLKSKKDIPGLIEQYK